MVPGRLLSASAGVASGGRAGQASEYLRLAFTQPPDVLARSAVALARASGRDRCLTVLDQGGPDQAVPGDQRGELVGGEFAVPPVPAGRDGSTM